MADALVLFGQQMQLAGLSDGTRDRYQCAMRSLAEHAGKDPRRVSERDAREYLLHLRNDLGRSDGCLRVAYAAAKFFFTHTVKRTWKTLTLVRAARSSALPVVLDRDEVREVIRAVSPFHNQVFFWTVYSLLPARIRGLEPPARGHRLQPHARPRPPRSVRLLHRRLPGVAAARARRTGSCRCRRPRSRCSGGTGRPIAITRGSSLPSASADATCPRQSAR
jgi:hypothetical protein